MFRVILVMLTCAGVLWHASVGCCAHHGHAAECPPKETSCCCGCRHEADDASDSSERTSHPQGNVEGDHAAEDCCGARCSFPAPETDSSVALKSDADAGVLVVFPPHWLCLAPSAAVVFARAHESPPDGAGMRRHLALSVLLI